MADDVNLSRRKTLVGITAAVGAVGAVGAAVPFVGSWQPSAKAKAAGAAVELDISKLEPGQKLTVEWRGKPVWVVRRPKEVIETLSKNTSILRDPESNENQQPDYAKNAYRSRNAEFLVLVGLCTHLGCSPTFRPELEAADLGKDWNGGFFCPCHGSKFDLAGRVFNGVPAPTNLVVPPYFFKTDSVIVIGEDGEEAKA
ncbi:MAG: ubiquinol-cytochrome c reductase iron-sulfur subunit [Pseudomonadota bacterium]